MPPLGIILLGLVYGSLAGLNSLGLILLWRTTRLINLAQPAMGLIGGVLTGLLIQAGHWSFWWAAPIGLLVGAGLAFGTDRLIFRRMNDAPRAVVLVATVGLAAIFGGIRSALPFAFTGHALPTYSIDIGLKAYVYPQNLLGAHLLVLIALPLTLLGVLLFVYRSRFGLAALALGQDSERARALGVSSAAVRSIVWGVAGVVATISGIFTIPILGLSLGEGLGALVLLFPVAAAVLAGFRSFTGAAVASLVLGVVYETVLWHTSRGNDSTLVFAFALLVVITLQRTRTGREEAASRTSSWQAAASMRPLPWSVSSSARFKDLTGVLVGLAVIVAALPPFLLSPSLQIAYAGKAAWALCVVAIGAAWMFAGEIALGHWGLAGLGAAVGAITPGPWPFRVVIAAIAIACVSAILGFASRRQSGLSFAVLGLAAMAAGPVAVDDLANHPLPSDPKIAGVVAAVVVVLAVAALTKLRGTVAGARMIAARDDPQRAPWLGVDPVRARLQGLAISGALAGAAGAFLMASLPIGIRGDSFSAQTSLDLLAWAVIGGLGSPIGVLMGALLVESATTFLPRPWGELASGLGVLLVVILRPGGLSRPLMWLRDRAVSVIVPAARATPVVKEPAA